MGGGRKRSRTQRRDFKQSRENVWKFNKDKNDVGTAEDGSKINSNGSSSTTTNGAATTHSNWEPYISQNTNFEDYYKEQGIVLEEEWEEFMTILKNPLPAAFRINSSAQFFQDLRMQLEDDFMKTLKSETNNEQETEAIRPLPWYPGNLAWHLNFSRMELRKNQTLEKFHEFLKLENEVGNITRQEAVSMVPPLFLDVLPHHHILDMCAAPGSKTFQLLELIHLSDEPGVLPEGLVVANDVDVQRCNLLIHQTKRMSTANLIVTNHEAQHFPSCSLKGSVEKLEEGKENLRQNALLFDRVLCDVPCSGDGTLRKAPDIWRKWNVGNGNGVHRLQIEIAMKGLALLKVGGRMVYSTCSMNPVENEAVVAELLRRGNGSIELLDVSDELPQLKRRCGLKTWKVRDKGIWLTSYNEVKNYRKVAILRSMFPSDQICNNNDDSCDDEQANSRALEDDVKAEDIPEIEHDGDNLVINGSLVDDIKLEGQAKETSSKTEYSSFPLERCMRILPHDQNTGAFFIAVLQKLSPLQDDLKNKSSAKTKEALNKVANHRESEAPISSNLISEVSLTIQTEENLPGSKTSIIENSENKSVDKKDMQKGKKGKPQNQGRWKGVDPVIFFKDEAIISSIKSFYGISGSFPFDGQLVTRNDDVKHLKRIYYISKSVRDTLQLNLQTGQRLKITSLGLKLFERQGHKETASPCLFRISAEGLPLLLPYINKQIIHASLADFRNLLQNRAIKFSSFVDAKFGEMAQGLALGCCVVVLKQDEMAKVDASTIAVVCWKGRSNLCIMLNEVDGKELLGRLSVRFGCDPNEIKDTDSESKNIDIDASGDIAGEEPVAPEADVI